MRKFRQRFFLSVLFFGQTFSFYSAKAQKHDITTGVFINSLYDFNIPDHSFKVDMWVWSIYKDSSLPLKDQIEFPNTKEFEFSNDVITHKDDKQWLTFRARGEVMKDWDVSNFPFDKQKLNISLGYSQDTSVFSVAGDIKNSKIDPDFKLPGWKIDGINFKSNIKNYDTNFGDPSNASSSSQYPQFDVIIAISREGGLITLLKMITGLIIAFFISCCVFFIKPTNTDPRFGLCVGGLFTAVGNKYITDSVVPSSDTITLIDTLHIVAFFYIFLIIIQSVISLLLIEKDNENAAAISKKFDWYSFLFILLSFFIVFIVIILRAYYKG